MVVTIGRDKVKAAEVKVGDKEGVEEAIAEPSPRRVTGLPGQHRTLGGRAPGTRTPLHSARAGSTGTSGRRRTSVWSPSPAHGRITFRPGNLITIEVPASSAKK